MKSKMITAAALAMAAIFLLGAGMSPVNAYDVVFQNRTGEDIKVNLCTRSDYSWDTFATALLPQIQLIQAGKDGTLQIPLDSRHMCLSYVYGYKADLSKGLVIMGCDGTENNMSSRCCANFTYKVVKNTDGTYHFLKQ